MFWEGFEVNINFYNYLIIYQLNNLILTTMVHLELRSKAHQNILNYCKTNNKDITEVKRKITLECENESGLNPLEFYRLMYNKSLSL